MPRNKPQPKPLFAVKHDFVDALDNVLQEAILLETAIQTVLDLDLVQGRGKEILTERLAAFKTALHTED